MSSFLSLIFRDLLRSFRSGVWYAAAATFYIAYAIYFDLIFSSAAGPQPQPISPLRSLFSGELLILWTLFIPVLVQKSLVEERQQKTWDMLLTTGLSIPTILLAKFTANLIQILFWVSLILIFPMVFLCFIELDLNVLLCAIVMFVLVSMHWLSLAYFMLCKTKSFVSAYFKGGALLLLYYLVPLLIMIWPDPYYRVIFETLDLRGVLDRAAQGIVLAHDVVWLAAGGMMFLIFANLRISDEIHIGFKKFSRMMTRAAFMTCSALTLIFMLMICHSRAWIWDFSQERQGELSSEYLEIIKSFPEKIEVTLALPKSWNAPSFQQARICLVAFLQKTQARVKGMTLEVLDPDIDYLAMERLKNSGGVVNNKIGFISIAYEGKRVNIPYHQWLTLGTMTIDNEAHRFMREFKGEDQLTRAVNTLTQDNSGKVLIFAGHDELDLSKEGALGGSEFLDLLQQFGLQAIRFKPDLDQNETLDGVKLIVVLDPKLNLSDVSKGVLAKALELQVPILGAHGPSLLHRDKSIFSAFGIEQNKGVVYQKHYKQYDPFTLPMAEFSNHPSLKGLQNRVVLFDHISSLEEGIASDPRLKVVPLLRTQTSDKIWSEQQYDPRSPMVRHTLSSRDLPSPLYTGMAAEWNTKNGISPAIVVYGTRSPFENRWIHQGANRELIFNSVDWLLNRRHKLTLPPSIMSDYKVEVSPQKLLLIEAGVTFLPTCLLLLVGIIQWRKRS